MKKIKLLLAAMAAMVGMGVHAQSWTASEVGEGYALLYNVGTGQYFTRGNGWNTQASIGAEGAAMTVELQAVGDNYFIRTGVNNNAYGVENLGSTVYTDQSRDKQSTWSFTQVDTDNGPVYNIVSVDNHSGGEGAYLTAEGGESTIVAPGTDGTADNAKWKVYLYTDQKAKALTAMESATEENPVDVTVFIVNPQFSTAISNTALQGGSNWTMNASNQNLSGGSTLTNPVAESWRSSFTLSQAITVPNGYYRLRAQTFIREYDVTGADYPVVYLDDATQPFIQMKTETASLGTVSSYFANGDGTEYYWTNWTDVVTVTTGSITVGVRGTRTNSWCAWDNFQLQYLGPVTDLSAFEEALAAAVETANATEGTIPTAAYNAIAAVVAEKNQTYSTGEEYTEATSAINNAVSTYASSAIVAAYSRYTSIKAAVLAVNSSIDLTDADALANDGTDANLDDAVTSARTALATYLAGANIESDKIDLTAALIDNAAPGISANMDYWTNSGNPSLQNQLYEYWNASGGTTKQNIATELPVGYYTLTAIAYTREGMEAVLNAGDKTMNIATVAKSVVNDRNQGNNWIAAGNGVNELTFQLTEATSNLEIGLTADSKTADYWMCWRSFKLEYLGTAPLPVFQTQLATAVAAANDHATALNGTIPAAASSAYTDAISAAAAANSTVDECLQSIANIETATATADGLVASYAEYKALKTKVAAMTSVENYTEINDATTTLTGAINKADADVEAATTADTITEQTAAVKTAGLTFLANVRSDGAHPFDITFLIANPGFDDNNIKGWERTFDGGSANTRCHSNEFYDNNSFDFYQTLTDMPKGNYELKVQAFQRPGYAGAAYNAYMAGNTSTDAVVYINDGETSVKHIAAEAQDNHLYWGYGQEDGQPKPGNYPDDSTVGSEGAYKYVPNSMEGAEVWFAAGHYDNSILTAVEGTLKLGFKADHKTADGTWTLFDNFRLYFYGQSINVAMDEAVAFSALADIEGANVTMARTTKVGFNTVALPFALDEDQTKAVFGDGAVVYEFSDASGDDADDATINFTTAATKIEANVPVLVKATKAVTEISADNVTVKTGVGKVEGKYFDFVANYEGQKTIAANDYFISGGKLYQSTGQSTIKGFRAYLQDKGEAPAEVKLFIDGVATRISEINGMAVENGAIYNIAGQRVNKAQKGIFIINGKKVVK